MSQTDRRPSEPRVLDQPWRIWSSIAVLGILLSGILLGVLIIPIVQGRGAGEVQEVCVSCHGETGVSISPDFPHLAGQSGAAIYKQLHDYRTGSRAHPQMTDIAKALDEAIIADVAAYYAGQPQRNPNPSTLAESPPAIIQLVELGDPRRNIPPCASCHRAGAGGPIETPVLAEQRAEYIVQQLKLYASGERRNDVYARMRTIASKLTPSEMQGLATYYRAGFR
jgi:cytochrome c553